VEAKTRIAESRDSDGFVCAGDFDYRSIIVGYPQLRRGSRTRDFRDYGIGRSRVWVVPGVRAVVAATSGPRRLHRWPEAVGRGLSAA
jgi:hypothetical protein